MYIRIKEKSWFCLYRCLTRRNRICRLKAAKILRFAGGLKKQDELLLTRTISYVAIRPTKTLMSFLCYYGRKNISPFETTPRIRGNQRAVLQLNSPIESRKILLCGRQSPAMKFLGSSGVSTVMRTKIGRFIDRRLVFQLRALRSTFD